MTRRRAALAVAGLAALLVPAPVASAYRADTPRAGALYHDGPSGRYLLGGRWLRRLDPRDRGIAAGWAHSTRTARWRGVAVPDAWNARDESPRSLTGYPAWYRKDFKLPDDAAGLTWIVRFEAANYRARVWLNGRAIGDHAGGYLPFELQLSHLRRGTNRLVVRIDNRRLPTDFPPSSFTTQDEEPGGGWWNYGGLTREIYLRRVDGVDLDQVRVTPTLSCRTCAARIDFAVHARSWSRHAQRLELTGTYGDQAVRFKRARIPPGGERVLTAHIRLRRPDLWSPRHPHLYSVRLDAMVGRRTVQRYSLHSGVRSLRVAGGRLLLNGRPTNFRGAAVLEDHPTRGSALTVADRRRLFSWLGDAHATELRSHYPLHPLMYELADRKGILAWTEIPVYQMKSDYLGLPSTRAAALDLLRQNILVNGNHPSVFDWSVGNELADRPTEAEASWFTVAAALAHRLDPSRPVAYALAGHPRAGCQQAYAPLDLIGLNDYFGWYTGQVAQREDTAPYLEQMRACHPDKALVVSEFGAEANRHGPVTEKGTFEFQQDWIRYQLGVFAEHPWLSGANYWTLQEYRVRPGWAGGNPLPTPGGVLSQKGVIAFDGTKKPAFGDLRTGYAGTDQYPAR